jgi:hypothetical protein
MAIIKNGYNAGHGKEPFYALLEMSISPATIKISTEVHQSIEQRISVWSRHSTSGYVPKKTKISSL